MKLTKREVQTTLEELCQSLCFRIDHYFKEYFQDENKVRYCLLWNMVVEIRKLPQHQLKHVVLLKKALYQIAEETAVFEGFEDLDHIKDEDLNEAQLKNANDEREKFKNRISFIQKAIETKRAEAQSITIDIAPVKSFITEYLQFDYEATIVSLTEEKDWRYKMAMDNIRSFWQKDMDVRLRDYGRSEVIDTDYFEKRKVMAAQKAVRKLFKIEQYTCGNYPYLYACYISADRKKSNTYYYKLYVAKIKEPKNQEQYIIISRYIECGRGKLRWEKNFGEMIDAQSLQLIAAETYLKAQSKGRR